MTDDDDVRPGEPTWYADLTPEGREKDRAEMARLAEREQLVADEARPRSEEWFPPFNAAVIDTGGGRVVLLVDRDSATQYPPHQAHVTVTPAGWEDRDAEQLAETARDQAINDRAAVVAKLALVERERDGALTALKEVGGLARVARDDRVALAERLDLTSAVLRELRQMQVTPTPEGYLLEILHWGGEAKALVTWTEVDGVPCWVLTNGRDLTAHAVGTLGECLATVARWDVDMQTAHVQEAQNDAG